MRDTPKERGRERERGRKRERERESQTQTHNLGEIIKNETTKAENYLRIRQNTTKAVTKPRE